MIYYIMLLVLIGIILFGVYTNKTIKEKFIESHFDYPNCVSYIPYTNTTLKNTLR